MSEDPISAENRRLQEDAHRERNWKRWGPYLSERQWGTVREDYSATGNAWDYFPHDHARSRAYRWGEDGLLGICDRRARLCFALALWNERDPILKERLFGLGGPEGNHGEDVKEAYFYLDATPTSSYLKALYKYPQQAFPYAELVDENRRRSLEDREYELHDTGVFVDDRYFDITAEYAKASPDDILIRIIVANRGSEAAPLHLLPTLWFRNIWSWGRQGEGYGGKPQLRQESASRIRASHPELGEMFLDVEPSGAGAELLFTENETNNERLFGVPAASAYVKDAFHAHVIEQRPDAVNPDAHGTKAAAHFRFNVPPRGHVVVRLRLRSAEADSDPFGSDFNRTFNQRIQEAQAFYEALLEREMSVDERVVARQGYAGLLWSKQFYHYVVSHWLEGDPALPKPPPARLRGRNREWQNLYNRDVISMPDAWEYPWYAAWDLAFHMIPFARLDPLFAKEQLILFLREWYMHPNGQIPAYEYAFSDVNPPVHAWAAWRVYKMTAQRGERDRTFLARVFQKLVLNFTWWVNRKDLEGNNLFSGGFLGLDNIGVFDRSKPLPGDGHLEQADGTAWMAFYCGTMLSMALELAREDPVYEDMASKFFEHFVAIVDAMNCLAGCGTWNEEDGFYYDQLHLGAKFIPLRVRSIVGLIPLFAVEVLDNDVIDKLPGFKKRLQWFLENRPDVAHHVSQIGGSETHTHRLLAATTRERLARVLRYALDENEFLSPYGIRSLSRVHAEKPFVLHLDGEEHQIRYAPGESDTDLFGGNSNWRGPIWLPLNYLFIEALERYHHFYGDSFEVEHPTGSGRMMTLAAVADDLRKRLASIFLPDDEGQRACHGQEACFAERPHWKDLVLFHEYFHGDSGEGLGASHQTGWTALVVRILEDLASVRSRWEEAPIRSPIHDAPH